MIYRFNLRIASCHSLPTLTSLSNLKAASFSSLAAESNLAKLRRKTGLAFTLCKKALELHSNDVEAATLYLKEESIKHGYAKAQKLKSRRTVQGLVGLVMDKDARRCALLEVNCETDFVARNTNFQQLTAQLTANLFSPSIMTNDSNPPTTNDLVTKRIFTPDSLNCFNDQISAAVTKLGENIKLSRAIILHLNDTVRNDLLLFGHAHASGDYIADIDGVKLGKYGSVVVVRQLPTEERKETTKPEEPADPVKTLSSKDVQKKGEEMNRQLTDEEIDNQELDVEFVEEKIEYTIENVGKILCQQIIGLNPLYLKKSAEQLAKEKELANQGYKIPEDSEYLLDQKTIVEPNLSVAEFCDNHGIQILDFIRYECGDSTQDEP